MLPTALLIALATLSPAHATSTGRTGVTTTGCSCHGTASSATTVTITPSATTVTPGGAITVSVTVSNSTKTGAGFNAGVVDAGGSNAGTLAAGTGSKVASSEVTHTARQTMTSGSYTFTFGWTAPSTPGTYRIRAAGNAVNSNGASSGDAWALATTTEITVCAADGDGDGVTVCGGDCNDSNGAIFPGATELPGDLVDQNCDSAELCYVDADNDGYRLTSTIASADADCADSGEGVATEPTGDCNDSSSAINPAATELPGDLVDQNCDGAELCYVDADNDGYRLTSTVASVDADCADSGEGVASEPTGDCNDASSTIRPGATELPGDLVDQNCDGAELCYVDADNDGYRLTSTISSTDADCSDSGEGIASEPTGDCNDSSGAINPGATELPGDLVDQNCDGAELCYVDADNDGYRLSTTITSADCADPGEGIATEPTGDCNDANALIRPGATETCDGVDQDCDGLVDDGAPGGSFYYLDVDGDGYGDPATQVTSCTTLSGYILAGGDCDDTRIGVNPAASEVCDAADLDEDCDGLAEDDDPSASGKLPWFVDADGDTYGDALAGSFCDAPIGAVRSDTDCDDSDSASYPSAPESCSDAVDYNCDGVVSRVDLDGDGWAACEECDDLNINVNPTAVEVCNTIDDDCNGVVDGSEAEDAFTFYVDADSDGYGDPTRPVFDCAAPEGTSASDADCDDDNPLANPEGTEVWYDGVDQDCDENDDDQDGDGAAAADDCDDTNPELIEDCGEDTGTDDGSADGADGADGGTADGADGTDGTDGTTDDQSDDGGGEDPPKGSTGCASSPAPAAGLGLFGALGALLFGLRRRR
jgi:MYXO-CTERM domain-containing protein